MTPWRQTSYNTTTLLAIKIIIFDLKYAKS